MRPSNLLRVSDQQLRGHEARLLDLVHLCDGLFSFGLLCKSDEAEASTTFGIAIFDHDLR